MWWVSSGHGHGSNRKKKHCNWWWCAACGGHFEWGAPNRILGVKVKGGWTPFQAFLATVGRLVSPTFVVCRWEERAEHRLVGISP